MIIDGLLSQIKSTDVIFGFHMCAYFSNRSLTKSNDYYTFSALDAKEGNAATHTP